eukprot:67593_1
MSNESMRTSKSMDCLCYCVETCISLQRLINFLKEYTNISNKDGTMSEFMNSILKKYLINDYHHILDVHLNEENNSPERIANQFKRIYKKVSMNLECDISKCDGFSRNNRQRENDATVNKRCYRNLSVHMDILDSIHCYFLHSVDTGYRIVNDIDEIENDNHNIHSNIAHDAELSRLKSYLQSTRKRLQTIPGLNRFENNKFMTEIVSKTNKSSESKNEVNDNDNDTDSEDEGPEEYSFGYRFDYWSPENKNYIEAKYLSLKHEITNNKIYSIDMEVFASALNKARELLHNSDRLKTILSDITSLNQVYGIQSNQPITVANILSVVLYTDYSVVSFKFS